MSPSSCFNKSSRLRKPSEFKLVYQSNQTRVRGQYFIVLAFSQFKVPEHDAQRLMFKDNAGDCARLGAVVSKKVSKLAVRRNRIKRLIRDQFRKQEQPRIFDFVVVAKPMANQVENSQLTNELNYLWRKLNKQCDSY